MGQKQDDFKSFSETSKRNKARDVTVPYRESQPQGTALLLSTCRWTYAILSQSLFFHYILNIVFTDLSGPNSVGLKIKSLAKD
jgi:hypothetical protein